MAETNQKPEGQQTKASQNVKTAQAKKKGRLTLMQRRALVGFLFISPWFIGFLLFYVRSLYLAGVFSLNKISLDLAQGGYSLEFIGLDNYIYAFTKHGTFSQVLVSSVTDMLIDVPLITAFSLLIAIMLNSRFKGRTLVRAIFFLPVLLNSQAIVAAMDSASRLMAAGVGAMDAETMADLQSGAANISYYISIFKVLGLPESILDYIVSAADRLSSIVSSSGVQIVIFIAALQSISPSLYEVARIEGATTYETFWKVTLPMVSPLIITNVVYTVVDSFVVSEIVELAYYTNFTELNYGLSSAMSLVSSAVVCAVLGLICFLISRYTFYYN
ncbi:MAG: sugar ABC transporter permease [Lachnospiraceae bacterium]|nr:sugar ABC transporter permease [Lachnospiraceae bacterium]